MLKQWKPGTRHWKLSQEELRRRLERRLEAHSQYQAEEDEAERRLDERRRQNAADAKRWRAHQLKLRGSRTRPFDSFLRDVCAASQRRLSYSSFWPAAAQHFEKEKTRYPSIVTVSVESHNLVYRDSWGGQHKWPPSKAAWQKKMSRLIKGQ